MFEINTPLLIESNNNNNNNNNIISVKKSNNNNNNPLVCNCKILANKIFSVKTILIYIVCLTLLQYRLELQSMFLGYNNNNNRTTSSRQYNKWPPVPMSPLEFTVATAAVSQEQGKSIIEQQQGPRIVLWTPYYMTFEDYPAAGLHNSTFNHCSTTCEIVYAHDPAKTKLQSTDAVIFTDIPERWKRPLPSDSQRHPNQTWILVLHESPSYTNDYVKIKSIFNWTMTYRRDSDVYHPFGSVVQYKPNTTSDDLTPQVSALWNSTEQSQNLAAKSKLAVIQVSHCNTKSNRESFLRELGDIIPIDIYGACGNLSCRAAETKACGHNGIPTIPCLYEQVALCFKEFGATYKFYLAFENSLCIDYVTEKFFHSLQSSLVPVVYGGANYSAFAPNHSFINVADFESAADLGAYLLHLDSNDEEYLKYFEWKKNVEVVDTSMTGAWCELCTKLSTAGAGDTGQQHKSYEDIRTWWTANPYYNDTNHDNNKENKYACKSKPNYKYKGWADKKKNSQFKK